MMKIVDKLWNGVKVSTSQTNWSKQMNQVTEQMIKCAQAEAIATNLTVFVGYDNEGFAVYVTPFSLN